MGDGDWSPDMGAKGVVFGGHDDGTRLAGDDNEDGWTIIIHSHVCCTEMCETGGGEGV